MPDRLFCILCKVPRFKEEAELRSDKERRMHPEARLLAVRPSQREAGVTWRGGRNLKKWIFFPQVALLVRTLLVIAFQDRWRH